jgi:hypothetical protein
MTGQRLQYTLSERERGCSIHDQRRVKCILSEKGAVYRIKGGCSIHDQRRVKYILSEEGEVYIVREGCSVHD